jgi:polar amino acid transport system ATP-binding protein
LASRLVPSRIGRNPGDEQQRVAIARALALGSAVLLFDEAASVFGRGSTGNVLRVMRKLAKNGMTMILVTHELRFARKVLGWTQLIDRGNIVEQDARCRCVIERRN